MKKPLKITLFILLFIILITTGIYFTVEQSSFGYSVLSVDEASFISNSDVVDGSAYLLNLVVDGGNDVVKGEISPETLESLGVKNVPEGTFKINIFLDDFSCNYDIIDDETEIFKIYQATARYSIGCTKRSCLDNNVLANGCPFNKINLETVKDACRGEWNEASRVKTGISFTHCPQMCGKTYAPMGTDTVVVGGASDNVGVCDELVDIQNTPVNPTAGGDASEWCYLMPREIMAGYDSDHWRTTHIAGYPLYHGFKLSTQPRVSYTLKVLLENEQGDSTEVFLSDTEKVQFIENIGRVKIVGNVLGNQFCPQYGIDYSVVKNLENNQYKVVEKDNYQHYMDVFTELANFDNNYYVYQRHDPGVGADVLWDKMSTLNYEFNQIYTQNEDIGIIKGNNLKTSEKEFIYPQLQLLIKAGWISIESNVGKPKINNAILDKISSEGQLGIIKIDLENEGLKSDSFDLSGFCDGENVLITQERIYIEAGESEDVNIMYRGTSGNHNCTVKAVSVNSPLSVDTYNINLYIEKLLSPDLPNCKEVPNQPCGQSLWQGYPICEWSNDRCEDKPVDKLSVLWYVLGSLVIITIFVFFKKGKRKKR